MTTDPHTIATQAGYSDADADHIVTAVRAARFPYPHERGLLAETLVTWLMAYDRPTSDAPGLVGAMHYAVDHGVITFKQVAQFIEETVPLAASAGQPLEDLLTRLADMTLAGMSASFAGERLREGIGEPAGGDA